jgi:HK97 family phage major capsid protein
MAKLIDLKQQRAAIVDDIGVLAHLAVKEGRAMTPAEVTQFEGLKATERSLRQEIEGIERNEGITRSLNAEDGFGLRPEQRFAERPGAAAATEDQRNLTLGGYLRSIVCGPRTEAERRAMSEGTLADGGYTVPAVLSARLIDMLRAKMVCVAAGALTVPLESNSETIAAVASDPTPSWRAENAAVAESEPTFRPVTFAPKSLAVIAKASRELLADSLNAETALPGIIAQAMAVELDRAALYGTNTSNQPKGLSLMTGVQTVGAASGVLTYDGILSARTKVRGANTEPTAVLLSVPDEGTVSRLVDDNHRPLSIPPALQNVKFLSTTSMPTNLGVGTNESEVLIGDFSKLLLGFREQISIQILRERYADVGQLGFAVHARFDVAAEYTNAFCKLTGITHS